MVVGPPSERPVVFSICSSNWEIVDARDTPSHEPLIIELPVLIAVRPEPVTRVVVPLVGKANRYAVALTGPELLDQPIVEFLGPLASQKLLDGLAPDEEFRAIAPDAVGRVGHGHSLWVPRVPGIFGQANFLRCACRVKRGKGWAGLFDRRHGGDSLGVTPNEHTNRLRPVRLSERSGLPSEPCFLEDAETGIERLCGRYVRGVLIFAWPLEPRKVGA
jgi:hypothetical protein